MAQCPAPAPCPPESQRPGTLSGSTRKVFWPGRCGLPEGDDLMWVTVSLPSRTLPAFISGMALFGPPTHKPRPWGTWTCCLTLPTTDLLCLFIAGIFSLSSVTRGPLTRLSDSLSEQKGNRKKPASHLTTGVTLGQSLGHRGKDPASDNLPPLANGAQPSGAQACELHGRGQGSRRPSGDPPRVQS